MRWIGERPESGRLMWKLTPSTTWAYVQICKYISYVCDWEIYFYIAQENKILNFAHVCSVFGFRDSQGDINTKEDPNLNLIHFPVQDESVDLISQMIKILSLKDTKSSNKLRGYGHHHSLFLFDTQGSNDEMANDGKLCNRCVRQISFPFYGCEECNFFLHKSCANLPRKLKHASHPLLSSLRCFISLITSTAMDAVRFAMGLALIVNCAISTYVLGVPAFQS